MQPRERVERELLEMLGLTLRAYFPMPDDAHPAIWVSRTFTNVAAAIAAGDARSVALACELIERDPMLPFGKLVKSTLARALKKQVSRILGPERRQVLGTTKKLLTQEFAPRELEDYCKLVKKFPPAEVAEMLKDVSPRNAKSAQLTKYLHASDA